MKVTSVIQHKYRQVNEILVKCRVIVFAKTGPLQASERVEDQGVKVFSGVKVSESVPQCVVAEERLDLLLTSKAQFTQGKL